MIINALIDCLERRGKKKSAFVIFIIATIVLMTVWIAQITY